MAMFGAFVSHGEVIDKIAIVVNNEMITQSDIDRLLGPVYSRYRTIYQGDELIKKLEEARQKIMEDMIEEKLILSEAKRLKVEVDERDIDARVEEMKERVGSKEGFEKALLEQRIAIKDLRARYREQLMVRRLIDQKIGSKVVITPVEINDYYNSHIREFVMPEEVKLRNILIKEKPEFSAQKAHSLAENIVKRLQNKDDFANLARTYSDGPNAQDGGLMGYVKKGDLLPEIEDVVFNLKEGENSDVMQSPLGYHIFKVEEKRPSQMLALSEVRHEVEQLIFRDKVKEKISEWVKDLKKNAYIAFK